MVFCNISFLQPVYCIPLEVFFNDPLVVGGLGKPSLVIEICSSLIGREISLAYTSMRRGSLR